MKELYNLIKPEIYNELKKREINLLEEVKFILKKEIKVRNVVSEKKLSEMLANSWVSQEYDINTHTYII